MTSGFSGAREMASRRFRDAAYKKQTSSVELFPTQGGRKSFEPCIPPDDQHLPIPPLPLPKPQHALHLLLGPFHARRKEHAI